ncbi:5-aminolevulinate synthase [Sulfitobacter sp. D35]|uniref:5-aminolevulinate synthase n=1 Tax=Sulfitobacter sp. D35 TaxID=3083252 RepID=UPI00296F884A|nr:5-aminolevulinate synthase [Sulfitobacter sp. D35]MDW4497660.1 5-aminolevulinate synthase [Sulfitobacter sp. D35]
MTYQLNLTAMFFLMLLAAGGYAVATVGMKMASAVLSPAALSLVLAGLGAAAIAEIVLLRHADLAVIYLGVILAESVLVLAYAVHLGGMPGTGQIWGATMVLAGFALVTLGE